MGGTEISEPFYLYIFLFFFSLGCCVRVQCWRVFLFCIVYAQDRATENRALEPGEWDRVAALCVLSFSCLATFWERSRFELFDQICFVMDLCFIRYLGTHERPSQKSIQTARILIKFIKRVKEEICICWVLLDFREKGFLPSVATGPPSKFVNTRLLSA